MVVVRFVKWSGRDTAVNPGQTPSTGYMRMLVFGNYAGVRRAGVDRFGPGSLIDRVAPARG